MRYIVKISYNRFEFDDPVKAVAFAEEAKSHFVDDKENEVDVEVVLKNDEPVVRNETEQEVE